MVISHPTVDVLKSWRQILDDLRQVQVLCVGLCHIDPVGEVCHHVEGSRGVRGAVRDRRVQGGDKATAQPRGVKEPLAVGLVQNLKEERTFYIGTSNNSLILQTGMA